MTFDEVIIDEFSDIADTHRRMLAYLGLLVRDLSRCEAVCIRIGCDHYGIDFDEMSFLLGKSFFMDKINVARRVVFKRDPRRSIGFDERILKPAERVNAFRNDLIHGLHLGPSIGKFEVARPRPLFETWDENMKNISVEKLILNVAEIKRVESELVRMSTISGDHSVTCHYEIDGHLHFVTFEHGEIRFSRRREGRA